MGARTCEPDELEMLLEKLHYLSRGADFVVFAGSLPRGVDADFYAEVIRELNRRQVLTVLDSEGEPLRLGLEAEPFLVSPNQREAEALVGQEFYEEEDFALALEQIAELGARNVLITNESGCFALLREERKTRRFRALAPQVEPVSAVGTGDVLLAGFIAAQLDGRVARGRAARRRSPPAPPRRSRSAPAASTRARPRRLADVRTSSVDRSRGRQPSEPLDLFSLEGLELGRIEVERLLALEEKFAREGLTFDDVLLVPGRVATCCRTTSRPRRG